MNTPLPISEKRQAGAILVTPEMLGAGVTAYNKWLVRQAEIAPGFREATLADEMYLAMERVRLAEST